MNAAVVLKRARARAGLSLRELARRAGTSHPTLVAYESGHKVPSVATLDRIVRRAGFSLEIDLTPLPDELVRSDRGRELEEVLELAEQFPVARPADRIPARFRRIT